MKFNWPFLPPDLRAGIDCTAGFSLLATVVVFSSCQDEARPSGWLTAAIREAADSAGRETTYRGSGDFYVGRDPGAGVSVAFELSSRGTGSGAGQMISLYWPGHGRPTAGRYALAPLKAIDGHLEGFTAFYQRLAAGRGESFTALSGYVIVRESSDDRLDGEFQLTGVLYCLANETPGQGDWCTAPTTITAGVPQVALTGSFAAVSYTPGAQSLTRP